MKVVFKAPERFDAAGVALNRQVIERLANSRDDVIVDMADVELIDGSGFGAIAHIYKRLVRQDHCVHVINVSGQPRELMQKTGLLQVLSGGAGVAAAAANSATIVAASTKTEQTAEQLEDISRKSAA